MAAAASSPLDTLLAAIDASRFDRLATFAGQHLGEIAWDHRSLHDLGLERAALVRPTFSAASAEIFAPFTGAWVGGDLRDARRGYCHLWQAAQREGPRWVQRVRMWPAGGGPAASAYNLFAPDEKPSVRGVVDGRPYIGFCLPDAALLWVGEETSGNISVHAEAVRAAGVLYEIRGYVFSITAEGALSTVARSDWRYHRVDPLALSSLGMTR